MASMVGYDQTLARVSELRSMTLGPMGPVAGTAPASAGPANAAAFQQQLAMAGLSGTATASQVPGADLAALGGSNPYAALLGGGLGMQAALQTQAPAAAVTNVTGKTEGLDPELLRRLDAVGRELGQKLDVISGHRSYEKQAELYQAYLNGTGNLAAKPGTSNHEHGGAADVYVNGVALADVDGAREIAARHGLHFPVGGESWHVERTDH